MKVAAGAWTPRSPYWSCAVIGVLKDFVRFIWKRDSDSAMCVMILMGSYLTKRDMLQMRDYFDSLSKVGD